MAEVKKTAAAKKTAAKSASTKTASKKPAKKAAAPKKSVAKKTAAKPAARPSAWNPGNEERYNMIQVAAYYLAERDQFRRNPVEYWTKAEAQIRAMLSK